MGDVILEYARLFLIHILESMHIHDYNSYAVTHTLLLDIITQ